METILVYFAICMVIIIAMLAYAKHKTSDWKEILDKNKAMADWKPFTGIALILLVILTLIYSKEADALEMPSLFSYTQFSLGVDHVYNDNFSATCKRGEIDDRLTGNGRIDQNLFSWYNVDLNVLYQHHSCALNSDAHTYDAIGISAVIRFNRK